MAPLKLGKSSRLHYPTSHPEAASHSAVFTLICSRSAVPISKSDLFRLAMRSGLDEERGSWKASGWQRRIEAGLAVEIYSESESFQITHSLGLRMTDGPTDAVYA